MLNILIEYFMNYEYKNVLAKLYHQVVLVSAYNTLIMLVCLEE